MQFDTYTTDSESEAQPQNDQHSWAKSLQPKQKRTKRFLALALTMKQLILLPNNMNCKTAQGKLHTHLAG